MVLFNDSMNKEHYERKCRPDQEENGQRQIAQPGSVDSREEIVSQDKDIG